MDILIFWLIAVFNLPNGPEAIYRTFERPTTNCCMVSRPVNVVGGNLGN